MTRLPIWADTPAGHALLVRIIASFIGGAA